ncbi:glycoside hydrolase family 43 protein [Tenacibaculum sp. 190524A05c]|uniref:glycoside hydrolase family 43 protein n=1 Tax=Tenacibaculum platacis TaxID=3137852 RepID=UPI0031FAB4E8
MNTIQNPILKGFNPDPSICRVGDDYYIATSTFEWFPGVQIHHSKDLKNWKVIAQPLNRTSQLDMKGVPDSCGVWAPCLSYKDGLFYLVYTNVKSFDGVWKDTPNYVVTAKEVTDDWSEPVYLNSSGFDGSFFHDSNGKTWYTSMQVDHRKGKFFGGIELQEYSISDQQLIGESYFITEGTTLGKTEGPHIYQKNGYYYLLLAEGGTEYGHAATILRSRKITGPYEEHPQNPILTCASAPLHPIQKSGHASLVESQNGTWYITFLVGRPLTNHGNCPLGRETAIEEIEWIDDWPYLKSGSSLPRIEIPAPIPAEKLNGTQTKKYEFNSNKLSIEFQSLRIPMNENWISLKDKPGYLRLKGKESLTSTHTQALIARRLQHFNVEVSAKVHFEPKKFQQLAGLVVYYNTGHYHYLNISTNGEHKTISVLTCDNYNIIEQEEIAIIKAETPIILKASIHHEKLQFSYSSDDIDFIDIGNILDMNIVSDDYVRDGSERYRPAFTGCFIGMCCQDLATSSLHADFEWFNYKEL